MMKKDVMIVTGAGQIGMAIARRTGFGKKIILGDKSLKNAETIAKTMNDAGYDVVNDLDGVLARFDEAIGLDRLRALHLNDSKNPLGSHKDRHERIGEGRLGVDAFERIVRHPRLRLLPMILETPNELEDYAREIALLRSLAGEA